MIFLSKADERGKMLSTSFPILKLIISHGDNEKEEFF
jgi:hypothetical protein